MCHRINNQVRDLNITISLSSIYIKSFHQTQTLKTSIEHFRQYIYKKMYEKYMIVVRKIFCQFI